MSDREGMIGVSAEQLPSHIDGWVQEGGMRRRAIYQAESEDGTAFLMQYNVHHRHTSAWFPVHRVELARQPTRVLREPSAKVKERIRKSIAAAQESAAQADA